MYNPVDVPVDGREPFTDYSAWRLFVNDGGRHTWHYLKTEEEKAAWPQTDMDKYWLGLPLDLPELPRATDPLSAARNGFTFYKHLQAHDGHWPGEYGGPMFLLPGLVIGSYVSGMTFKHEERLEFIRYLLNHANEDGGWGIHVEGESTVFGTALNYCVMRILGVHADHPALVKARACLQKLGGATGAPAWGKFWLSVLNVYEWDGVNSMPPELLLLPDWVPIQPHKWWIHIRTVFIPMSYLYGIRFKAPENELIHALREELYPQSYHSIDWPAQRNNIAQVDIYSPHTLLYDSISFVLAQYELCALRPLRRMAIDRAYELIKMEDENTSYQTLGPVSKMMNLVARVHVEGLESEAGRQHERKRADFMWVGKEGMMMCGTNGSQLWDAAFIAQALVETGLADEAETKDGDGLSNRECLVKLAGWLDQAQMTENPRWHGESYRHRTKGAWGFSTKEQGYTVSDCTGEGLKAVLYLQAHGFSPEKIADQRLFDAVDTMLSLQNPSGGFASYELIRGPKLLEWINPAEVFGDIMIEYTYPECTTSVITALAIFRKHYPSYRSADIEKTMKAAISYIHNAQRPNGGWFGSWGICFTYATQFALESLSLVGETYANSKYVKKACDFLIRKQRADGGWGESYKSCEVGEWVEHEKSQIVQTAWAAMALMYGKYPNPAPIERAVRLVMERQLPDGSWTQEAIEGVFNKNVAIGYPNFKFSFTIWMLGMAHKYLAQFKTKDKSSSVTNGNGRAH